MDTYLADATFKLERVCEHFLDQRRTVFQLVFQFRNILYAVFQSRFLVDFLRATLNRFPSLSMTLSPSSGSSPSFNSTSEVSVTEIGLSGIILVSLFDSSRGNR